MYSYEDRMRAVIEMCPREGSAATVAADAVRMEARAARRGGYKTHG